MGAPNTAQEAKKANGGSAIPAHMPDVPANGGANIPPPDAPAKLSKYARFVVSEELVSTRQEKAHGCTLGTPPKNSFIRIHPDKSMRLNLHVLVHETGNKKKTYLIDPGLQADPDLEGLTKIIMVVPYVTHHRPHKMGLWPISIEHETNPWIQSALNIMGEAQREWLKVIPVTQRGEYITRPPAIHFEAPQWQNTPALIDGWLDLAFNETDWLTPDNWEEHPVRDVLRKGD